jgi:hypothetical protein
LAVRTWQWGKGFLLHNGNIGIDFGLQAHSAKAPHHNADICQDFFDRLFPLFVHRKNTEKRFSDALHRRKGDSLEKVDLSSTTPAVHRFHPKKILYVGVFVSAVSAFCAVQLANVPFQLFPQEVGCFIIGGQIKMLDFLLHNPVGHRVDVETDGITADAVCFQEGRASPIKGRRS